MFSIGGLVRLECLHKDLNNSLTVYNYNKIVKKLSDFRSSMCKEYASLQDLGDHFNRVLFDSEVESLNEKFESCLKQLNDHYEALQLSRKVKLVFSFISFFFICSLAYACGNV